MTPGSVLQIIPGVPIKTRHFFTKLEVIAFCSDAKIFLDFERVRINLDFNILASPVCQPFFEICQFKYYGLFFQELTLGHFFSGSVLLFS